MVMLMLLREAKLILAGEDGMSYSGKNNYYDDEYLGNDEYFTKNYDLKFGKENNIDF